MSNPHGSRGIVAATLLTTAMAVVGTAWAAGGSQTIKVPGSHVVLNLWEAFDGNGQAAPHYNFTLDDGTTSEPRATSYDIKLRYDVFDPLGVTALPEVPASLASAEDTNLYIVQYLTQPLEVFRDALRDLEAEPLFFLANHCHIVKMDPNVVGEVEALPFVRWVGDFHPAYRLDPLVFDSIMNGETGWQDFSIMVFGRGLDAQNAVADELQALGGMVMNTAHSGFRMTVTATPDMIAQIVRMDEVHFIDPWGPGELDMDIVREIGGANYVEGATGSFPSGGISGEGVRGEIFDTEVNASHPEWLYPPIIHCAGGTSSHGSSCYGINFAQGLDPQARGLCPDGQGIFCYYNVSTQFGGPETRLDLNTEATDPAGPYRSCYQTSSVGSPRTTVYTAISAETDDYLFQVDYLSFQSQSNATDQMSRPQAWAKNICSVGGIYHHDTLTRSDDGYSAGSMGPAADGRIKPDLAHFYDSIYTTGSSGYTQFGGTSGATPCTSGHGGLTMQMWHEGVWPDFGGGPSVFDDRPKSTTTKALLINNAYRYVWYGPGAPNPEVTRNRQGWGMADIGRMYDMRDKTLIVNETDILTNGQSIVYNVAVGDPADGFQATMIYLDPAGSPASPQARINDLTLKVTAPDGTVYWGNNGLHTSNFSSPGGVPNDVDTTECVFLESPDVGMYAVEVIAHEINEDSHVETPQIDADFALVVTGAQPGPGFGLTVDPQSHTICAPAEASYDITVEQFMGYTQPVTFTADNAPPGTTVTFSVNPVVPPGSTTMTVSDTASGTPGTYTIAITGTAPDMQRSANVNLGLSTAAAGGVTLTSPANGAGDVSIIPTFEWSAASQAQTYDLQVATDPAFANVEYSATTTETTHTVDTALQTLTTYYWHVQADNTCGSGGWSETFSFMTQDVPSVLLVDDDDNGPDVRSYYTEVLDGLGVWHDVWDTNNSDNEPSAQELAQYEVVVWFTGDEWGGYCGPGSAGEAALATWLDNGGCLFITSQDYHYDRGLTAFMQSHLGVSSVVNDEDQNTVTGAGSVFGGMGPYPLSYPITNYSDVVHPSAAGELAFSGDMGDAAVDMDGGVFRTTFWGFPFEAVGPLSDRVELMQTFFDWCGGLTPDCPADLNGDGVVDVLDLLAVLAVWGPCPGCPEDINGDGVVNVLDLLEVLAAWGPCP